jgi:hypothetical protein
MRKKMDPQHSSVSCRCIFAFLLLFLIASFDLSLFFRSKRSSSPSSPRAQLSITPSLVRGGDDVFSATMPSLKPSARLGGFSLKKLAK